MEFLPWIAAALAAVSFASFVWLAVSAVKIKHGWQNGASPVAKWLDARRRAKFDEQLPEALATMSNALRAGLAISQAFDAIVENGDKPIAEEFEILQRQMHVGMSFEDALQSMTARVGSDDLSLVATALLVARRSGGNVTEIFDKIAATIRERMRVERKVRSLTAQGRMQGIIVSSMPVILGGALTAVRPRLMLPFFCSLTGAACLAATALLIAAGWLVIRRIVRIDV